MSRKNEEIGTKESVPYIGQPGPIAALRPELLPSPWLRFISRSRLAPS